MRSGVVRSAGALALLVAAGGCLYSFHGGGLPGEVRTVAVLPFDNRTGEPALTQEVYAALQDAVSGRLGLRQVNEAQADALVRGEITSYVPDSPLAYQAGQPGTVSVTLWPSIRSMAVIRPEQKGKRWGTCTSGSWR